MHKHSLQPENSSSMSSQMSGHLNAKGVITMPPEMLASLDHGKRSHGSIDAGNGTFNPLMPDDLAAQKKLVTVLGMPEINKNYLDSVNSCKLLDSANHSDNRSDASAYTNQQVHAYVSSFADYDIEYAERPLKKQRAMPAIGKKISPPSPLPAMAPSPAAPLATEEDDLAFHLELLRDENASFAAENTSFLHILGVKNDILGFSLSVLPDACNEGAMTGSTEDLQAEFLCNNSLWGRSSASVPSFISSSSSPTTIQIPHRAAKVRFLDADILPLMEIRHVQINLRYLLEEADEEPSMDVMTDIESTVETAKQLFFSACQAQDQNETAASSPEKTLENDPCMQGFTREQLESLQAAWLNYVAEMDSSTRKSLELKKECDEILDGFVSSEQPVWAQQAARHLELQRLAEATLATHCAASEAKKHFVTECFQVHLNNSSKTI